MDRTVISNTPGVVFASVTSGKGCNMIGTSLMRLPGVEMLIRAISSLSLFLWSALSPKGIILIKENHSYSLAENCSFVSHWTLSIML